MDSNVATTQSTTLLSLPDEIVQQILGYLTSQQLLNLSQTCRYLKEQSEEDHLWAAILRPLLPSVSFPPTSAPSPSYQHLYLTHYPYWFLAQHAIWFSDDPYTGKLILAVYNPTTGSISGYRLTAERPNIHPIPWSYKPAVIIHPISPEVYLSTTDPILSLPHPSSPDSPPSATPAPAPSTSLFTTPPFPSWARELPMTTGHPSHRLKSSFFLTRSLPPQFDSPNIDVWPPRTIPDMPRTRASSGDKFAGRGHKPQRWREVSTTSFRTRRWSGFFGNRSDDEEDEGGGGGGRFHMPAVTVGGMMGLGDLLLGGMGVRIGEEVSTWSTLDKRLYMPTKEKPYQGVFVGDYASHGCEFLLVMQSEKAPREEGGEERERRRRTGLFRGLFEALEDEEDEEQEEMVSSGVGKAHGGGTRLQEEVKPNVEDPDGTIHRGALEAIKLTGDINVPRGEHTFIADDIGEKGFVRIAHEHPFRGARVVKSRGHVAARGFREDEFIPSQLFLVNPNLLAQYWMPFGHISYYTRVDIDGLMAGVANAPTQSGAS